MSSNMSQSVQHIIDANAPMVFTYAYSRPEFQRMVYPIGIVGDVVHTLDAETNKFKKFKLDGIVFPKPSNEKILSYALEQGSTVSFYYRNSNPEFKRVGVPVKLSKNGKAVLLRIENYLPYRRYSNQIPTYTEHKYFTIDAMENLQTEHHIESLPERHTQEPSFPDWIMNTDWSHGLDDTDDYFSSQMAQEEESPEVLNLRDFPKYADLDEPLTIQFGPEFGPGFAKGFAEYLRGDGVMEAVSEDEDESECETTDEEYLPSSDDDEKSCSDDDVYEDEGVRVTKKMVEEEAAKQRELLARNRELQEVVDNLKKELRKKKCTGCRHGIANQQAHYGGCIDGEEY